MLLIKAESYNKLIFRWNTVHEVFFTLICDFIKYRITRLREFCGKPGNLMKFQMTLQLIGKHGNVKGPRTSPGKSMMLFIGIPFFTTAIQRMIERRGCFERKSLQKKNSCLTFCFLNCLYMFVCLFAT